MTKRSHYLPQTYLKHFLLENSLFMYKKGKKFFNDDFSPTERIVTVIGKGGLKNIGLKNNLYNPNIEKISVDDLEEIFREYGENFYNDIVSSIRSLVDGEKVPSEIKDKLCLFMAAMRVRTPQFKWETEEMGSTFLKHDMARKFGSMNPEEIVKFYKEKLEKNISISLAKRVKEYFSNKKYELKYPNAYFIKMALLSLDQHADIFHQMSMNFFRSEDRYFITSDNPVVFFVPPEKVNFYNAPRSLMSPFSELFFSVTKNIGVTLNWRKVEEKIMPSNRNMVDIFNYNISHNSFDFIFSPIKMNKLNEFVEEYIPYPFKIEIR